jgi:hypothetical protein
MVLQSRPIAKSAVAAMAMAAAAAASANTQKPAAAKSVTPPRVLQSANSLNSKSENNNKPANVTRRFRTQG